MNEKPLLTVRDLEVSLAGGPDLISGVDLDVHPGEAVGLVGESGSGKSMLALAVAGLLPAGIGVTGGAVRLGGEDLLTLPPRRRRALLGRRIAMVFQEPRTSLHPAWPVGAQVAESVRRTGVNRREAGRRAVALLGQVGIPDPERRSREYAHQFSGGMCQRVGLAIALAQDPELLLADEPTTALDVTIQAEMLDLLGELRAARGLALLLITHDLAVVAGRVSRVAVLYAGRVAETAAVADLFARPRHPYTRGLLGALPGGIGERLVPIRGTVPAPSERPRAVGSLPGVRWRSPPATWGSPPSSRVADPARAPACGPPTSLRGRAPVAEAPLLSIRDLFVRFRAGAGRAVCAVRGVSLTVERGETVSLVGKSGSGKTSLVRAALRLGDGGVEGRVLLGGEDLLAASRSRLRQLRRRVQLVFQDPFASLNPKIPVGRAVAEPLRIHGLAGREEAARRAAGLLERVGLDPVRHPDRLPSDLSGGQRQRVAIARALAVEPALLVLDEPVSALDVSEQARVLNLLSDLKAERGLSYLLIAHDLAVVRSVSDRVAVMYLGQVVEEGPARAVLGAAAHPYTRALLASSPVPDPARPPSPERARGEPPSPLDPPPGCAFHPRCALAEAACAAAGARIPRVEVSDGHLARCRLVASRSSSV